MRNAWVGPLSLVALVAACGSGKETGDDSPSELDSGLGSSSGHLVMGSTTSSSGGTSSGEATRCGAGQPMLCAVGAACASDADCEGKCLGTCAAPSTHDGKRSPSLGETDVDCGGPSAPHCAAGQTCVTDGDCSSTACGVAQVCVLAPSCRGTNGPAGIDSCGALESNDAAAAHESCCRSLPLPTTTTRALDRYEITSGRLREFVETLRTLGAGNPDVRAYAHQYATAHPASQLAEIDAKYSGLLDVLPDHGGPTGALPLPVHLGAFPMDPINTLDGCYTATGTDGHASYWQDPADVGVYHVGDGAGVRVYPREDYDEKPVNCVMPIMLATFCAWDGGELARTSDYHEIWGRNGVAVGSTTVYVPWQALLPVGDFDWRNGHGAACPIPGWPGCMNPQPLFYEYPVGGNHNDDDAPAIGAPGRFPNDVTKIRSASGDGWFDVGGNLMEAAWPGGPVDPGPSAIHDVCDSANSVGPGDTKCTRTDGGVVRYKGALPHVALVGYSFEVHQRRSEKYLSAVADDTSLIDSGDLKPVSFQYGKVGGRCVRTVP